MGKKLFWSVLHFGLCLTSDFIKTIINLTDSEFLNPGVIESKLYFSFKL